MATAKQSEREARRRKEWALARKHELQVAQIEGRLVDAAEVRDAWVKVAAKLKDAVLRIPDKVAPAVHAAGTVQECRTVLQAECESILRTLADELRNY
jgi:hypothetical protein